MIRISPDTTDQELEEMAEEGSAGNPELKSQRLIALQKFRAMAISHSTEEPKGLRKSLNID